MLRATDCQGGRAPLLIQEGDGARAGGWLRAEALPTEQSYGHNHDAAVKRRATEVMTSVNRKFGVPVSLVPVFLGKRYLTPFPPHDLNFAGLDKPDQKTYNCTVWLLWWLILRSCSRCC
jgi:hypothetical protein